MTELMSTPFSRRENTLRFVKGWTGALSNELSQKLYDRRLRLLCVTISTFRQIFTHLGQFSYILENLTLLS